VPVNISCIQDQPDYVFHITAYNSQVDKILDVRLTQPGMSPLNSSIYRLCKDLYLCCVVFSPFFSPLINKRERKCRHRRYYTSPSIVWRTEQPLDNQKTSTGCEESTGARGGQWTCNEPLSCSLSLDGKMCNKLASLFIQI
jgi:hypothetical protein